jgi:hypothetical protein
MRMVIIFFDRHAEKYRFDIHKVQDVGERYKQVVRDCLHAAGK